MTRILIVDDEPAAGNILKLLIEKNVPGEKFVQYCGNAQEAAACIKEFNPSLLMLDIEMPHMNGFDLLNSLGSWNFDVIFTTAFNQYAIKAIRFSALDYLLKPIDILDLQNAVNRHIIKQQYFPTQQHQLVNNLISNLKQKDPAKFKLALSTTEGVFFFEPQEIIRLEGESNYTRFYFTNRKPLLISHTLKDYEEILQEHGFIRPHKSHLINKQFVKQLDREGFIMLSDGSQVNISRRKREDILRELKDQAAG